MLDHNKREQLYREFKTAFRASFGRVMDEAGIDRQAQKAWHERFTFEDGQVVSADGTLGVIVVLTLGCLPEHRGFAGSLVARASVEIAEAGGLGGYVRAGRITHSFSYDECEENDSDPPDLIRARLSGPWNFEEASLLVAEDLAKSFVVLLAHRGIWQS